jgi:iron complex outermembrane receptor protein
MITTITNVPNKGRKLAIGKFVSRKLPAIVYLFISQMALADGGGQSFHIPPQSLSSALNDYAEAANVQLSYPAAKTAGLQSAGVDGEYASEQALRQLLAGTGLTAQTTANGTVTLVERGGLMTVADTTPAQTSGSEQTMPKVTVEADSENPYNDPSWTNDPRNTDYNRPNTTTATKTDTPLMQTPLSVKVVPGQVLKDQQVITVDQALRNVSGVVSGAGGTGTFFIRGFGNFNLYRDGFLNQSQWAHTEDLENIERVEVLKGPGSVLYGRTEPGGLVNFVTKQPLDMPYYSLRQQFGSFDHYRTSIDATGPITASKDLAYRFNLGYQTNRNFQEFGGNERLLVAPTLRWKISDQTTSTLKVEYSDIQEKGRGTVPLIGNRPAPIPRSRNLGEPWNIQEDEYVMVSLNTEHAFNDNWKLRHRFNFTNYNLTMSGTFPDGTWGVLQPNGDYTRSFFAQNTDGNDYQHNFFNALELTGKFNTGFAKHTLLMGGDYYRSDYRATMAGFGANLNFYDSINITRPTHKPNPPAILSSDVSYFTATIPWFGLYAQDQIELPYHIHLLGGLRYDNAESSGSSAGEFGSGDEPDGSFDKVSPRGGILWQPIPQLSLYGSYTENFGASNFIGTNGRPLPPQTAEQWEAGIKTEFFNGRLNASLAYFDLTKKNLPIAVTPLLNRTEGEAESRGLEFDFSGELLPGWNIIGNYAYTPFAKTIKDASIIFDANFNPIGVGPGNTGKRLNNAPVHNGNLWTTYEFQNGWAQGLKFGAGVQAVSQREIGYGETGQAPGYVTLNLMASKLWKVGKTNITTQLNVDNVLDKTYFGKVYSYGPTEYGAPLAFMGAVKVEY